MIWAPGGFGERHTKNGAKRLGWLSGLLGLACGLLTSPSYGQAAAEAPARAAREPVVATQAADVFLAKPYVQWGQRPAQAASESLELLWQTNDVDAAWRVEIRKSDNEPWAAAGEATSRTIAVPTVAPHRLYKATLAGLEPGRSVEYRVLRNGESVFSARAQARKPAGLPHRFVVFGDCAAGTLGQMAVAHQAFLARPDFVFIPGDIVYDRGRISEYRKRFFPVYNADTPSPASGAPLLRSTLFVAAPGNHDTATRDLRIYPDGLAYFLYWSQPLNGPASALGDPFTPTLSGPAANQRAFLEAAGASYPRMANFSFDYGDAHWTVLDANTYVDWTDPKLAAWLAHDLEAARGAAWRFVGFHHPGFNSSHKHFDEQRMRVLSEAFERGGVDIVFNGHVHNYQRTFPLRFVPRKTASGKLIGPRGRVDGTWTLDRSFDGRTNTRPQGVIYLVSGAGGAGLYDAEQQYDPRSWQEFTHRFIAETHSLTVVDVDPGRLSVRQVAADGRVLDAFQVTRPLPQAAGAGD